MTSMPSQIGPYGITREIGRGGMGVVYLGHDPKLDRPVAIKALNEDLASDAERRARFEREARVLASLSHGNIATVYGFEECDGQRFLVMEFVEGMTLAERLTDGPLSITEALAVCAQIAAGVEAAHDAGIVHRDLKPGNVIIRPDGVPKVLDFGLARELPARSSHTDLIAAATSSRAGELTQLGVSIGTPGYMSPEQVRGMAVDRGTDTFAFGCILFECLVGVQAFPGDTVTDCLASILRSDPDWKALPPGTPPTVQLLLRRCLQKDRRRRLRDIGDARIELEHAIDDPTSTVLGLAGAALAAADHQRGAWRHRWPWIVAGVAIVAALASWGRPAPQAPEAPPVMRFVVPIANDHPLHRTPTPAVSPDGTRMVFRCRTGTRNDLFLRRFDRSTPELIEGTNGAFGAFFSPDGEWIAFAQDGKLRKVSVRGGPPTTLCSAPNFRGGTWGPDGTIVAALDRTGGLSRVLAAGGTPEIISTPSDDGEPSHRSPHFLPDGRGVIFTASADGGDWDASSVMILPFDVGEPRVLFANGSHGQYVGTGHVVFVREGTLMAARFDLDRQEVNGPAVPVLENVTAPGPDSPAFFAISATGTLTYMTGRADEVRHLAMIDLKGLEQQAGAQEADFDNIRLSPDGRHVALTVTEESNDDVKILELERDIIRPLTFDTGTDRSPVWSPDGRWIVFASDRDADVTNLYRVRSDFTGTPERLTECADPQWPDDWSPDGRTIVFSQRDPDNDGDIWFLHLDDDGNALGEPEPVVRRMRWQWRPRFSPDGRWLLYASAESGQPEIYVRAVSGPGAEEQVSTEGGYLAEWSPIDDRIYYTNSFDRPAHVLSVSWSVEAELIRFGHPEELLEIDGIGPLIGRFDMTNDGERFVVTRLASEQSERREPIVVLNWFEELKSRTRTVSEGG